MSRRRFWISSALAVALAVPAFGQVFDEPTPFIRPVGAGPLDEDAATLKNHHADLNAAIDSRNIADLAPAWHIETPTHVSHTPIVDDGRVYFADWGGTVYAADLQTGEVIWKKQVEQPQTRWPWHGFAGVGVLGSGRDAGTLFQASVEGTAFALDAETGEVRWTTDFAEDEHAGNVGRLAYHDGLVFVPVQSVEEPLSAMIKGFEVNFRGKVLALEARTGEVVWETPLVEPPHTGVAVWSAFAIDPTTATLYFDTGNNYTGEATELSDALIAADLRTGEIRWHRQVTDHDVWTMAEPKGPDYDFGAAPQLFEATIGGRERRLVGAGQKSGTYYVWDRDTGEPVWTTTVGYGQVGGGIHAEASIGDGRIFIWGNNAYPYHNPNEHPMDVKAVDAATGEYLWVKPKAQPAALTSAGFLASDVYFVASLDGQVRAYRASDGEKLWTSQEHGPIGSSVWVADGTLLFGTGVPAHFGGASDAPNGVWAYRPGAAGVAATQPAEDGAARPAGERQAPATRPTTRPRDGQAGQQQGEARTVEVIATDYDFQPVTIEARPGERLRIVLINRGDVPHNIEFHLSDDREAKLEQAIAPGERATLTISAPQQPGEYVYYCPVANHHALGMEGKLVVERQGQAQQQQ